MNSSDDLANWKAEAERQAKEEEKRQKEEQERRSTFDGAQSTRAENNQNHHRDEHEVKDVISIRLDSSGKAEILDKDHKVVKTLDEKSTEPWAKGLREFTKELSDKGLLKPEPAINMIDYIHDEKGGCKIKVNGKDHINYDADKVPKWITELSTTLEKEKQLRQEIGAAAKGLAKGGVSTPTDVNHDAVSKSSSPTQAQTISKSPSI
jgi:hypothetical protein